MVGPIRTDGNVLQPRLLAKRIVLGRDGEALRRRTGSSLVGRRSLVGRSSLVDAMVLSGCRICSNLTNDNKHFEGGTRRQCKRTKERKAGESKANAGGSRYAPQRLSSGSQDGQRRDRSVGELSQRGGAAALRRQANDTRRASGGGVRSRAVGLHPVSKAHGCRSALLRLCA